MICLRLALPVPAFCKRTTPERVTTEKMVFVRLLEMISSHFFPVRRVKVALAF